MIIVFNHKCNFNQKEFLFYQENLKTISSSHQLVLCPSFLYLAICSLPNFLLGAQNVSSYDNGAYTGEISASQLKSMGVSYVLVGHSERRNYFNEDEGQLRQKIFQCLKNNITPIFCIGESMNEDAKEKIKQQLKIIEEMDEKERIIVAYEPIWAIGSGVIPTISQIEEVVLFIKQKLPKNKVIYGGSIHNENISNLKSSLLDGYLLGGLSLDQQKLQKFLNQLPY